VYKRQASAGTAPTPPATGWMPARSTRSRRACAWSPASVRDCAARACGAGSSAA